MTAKRKAVTGLIVGATITVLGPLCAVLFTVISVNQSFESTKSGSIAADQKARHLADGISSAMNATVFGIVLGVIGLIVILISVIMLIRAGEESSVTQRV